MPGTAGLEKQLGIYNLAQFTPHVRYWWNLETRSGNSRPALIRFPLHGNLDDLWVFSGALTGEEVAQLTAAKPLGPSFSIEVSEVRLCWQSQTNITYQVQYRSDLTTNQWLNLGAPIAGTGATSCMADQVTRPRRFYRVVTLP